MRNILFILLFVLGHSLCAQNFVFEKITTREGLSQNDVSSIYQDENGFLWIGTNDGLNRYDGYSFKTFRVDPADKSGILSNLVFDITEDAEGNLWMGTSDQGVFKLNVETEEFTTFQNTKENPDLLWSNQIITIKASDDDKIWIGSREGVDVLTVNKEGVHTEKFEFDGFSDVQEGMVSDIEVDVFRRIWIATRGGLFVFSEDDGLLKAGEGSDIDFVKDILICDNEIFISRVSGVYCSKIDWNNKNNFDFIKVCDVNTNHLLLSAGGNLFMGTDKGLYIARRDHTDQGFDEPQHFKEGWEANSLSKNVISSLFEDKSGIIWIGTNGGGLNKYNPKQKKFRHFNKTRIEGSLSYNKIRSIYEDSRHNIWFATEGGGINFLPESANKNFVSGFKYIEDSSPISQNRIYTFVELESEGPLKVLAGSGYPLVAPVIQVQNNTPEIIDPGIFSEIFNSPFTMIKGKNDVIWIGTYGRVGGLFKYIKMKMESS